MKQSSKSYGHGAWKLCLALSGNHSLVAPNLLRCLCVAVVLVYGFTSTARAQATWGSITGYVSDQSGALVPHAKVAVVNEQTGIETDVVTDDGGLYNLTHVNPGVYTVSVDATGFTKFSKQHLTLQVDSTVRADFALKVGTVGQEIVVSADAVQLKTEKTDVDHTIDRQEIESVPMADHNLTRLYLTAPGVIPQNFQIGNHENPSEGFMTSVNGQLWMANDYQIDGISDIAWGFSGLQIINPAEDSVEQLKITTSNYDPEFGSVGGMVAQYVTKSGGNRFHGDAYWFNRNAWSFAANPFTEKIPGTGRSGHGTGPAPYNENVGGASAGGAIKKNKIFYFGDFRVNRRVLGANFLGTVPNDAFRNGDFSASTHPIYDPNTGNPDGTGRTKFSNNIIPAGRIDNVAKNLLALLPHANINQNLQQNYLTVVKSHFHTNQYDGRLDWNISDNDKVFGRYTLMRSYLISPGVFGLIAGGSAAAGGNPATTTSSNQLLSINYTHTFSPSLLAELRIGAVRFDLKEYQNDSNLQTDTQVGIPGINDGSRLNGGLAGISIAGPDSGFSMGISGSVPRLDHSITLQLLNNWTKILNQHEIRWGVDLHRNIEDLFTLNQSTRGQYNFVQAVTAANGVSGSGLGMASFLLGGVGQFQRGQFVLWPDERATRTSAYVGDTWKVNSKLTASYGARWDYIGPVTPKNKGGDVNFDFNTGELILAGLGNVSMSSNVEPRYNNFAPRLGLAYKITNNTVIRAGLGRSYFMNGFDAAFNHLDSAYPVAQSQIVSQTSTFFPVFQVSAAPPPLTPPVFPASGRLTPPSTSFIKAFPFERKTPSIDSWNVSLEQQLGKDFTVGLAYVANKGTHLDYSFFNVNVAPPGPGTLLSRRPYYQKFGFPGSIFVNCTCDDSNFNAAEATVFKRFNGNFSIHSSLTWSKALDHEVGDRGQQGINPYDRKAMYGVSYLNRAIVWTTTHSVDLPFGEGKRFGSSAPAVAQVVLGGWKFSGMTTIQSGLSLSPTDSDATALNADFAQRPNRVPGVSFYPSHKSRTLWLNKAAFAQPAQYQWGNAPPGIMRGPAYYSEDWAFAKLFTLRKATEGPPTTLQFRWENFNLFNHANLALPNADINNPLFGQITNVQDSMRRMQVDLQIKW
jgi:hypothetical protein